MNCPICDKDTKVLDSRVATDGITVRRRRECIKCSFRFSTIEEIEILDLTVIKRDGRREVYNKEKIRTGIKKALEKRNHSEEEVFQLIRDIETHLQKMKKDEVYSSQIGDIVMNHLKKFDKVAYIRYASVYRSFDDIEGFQEELKKLTKK